MSETDQEVPSDEILAGEYALGVLDDAERRAVEARIEEESAFAGLVDQWNDYLSPLTDGIAPVDPPAYLRERIIERLFADEATPTAAKASLWESLQFWRGAAIVFGAFAFLFLAILLGQGLRGPQLTGQVLVATLQPPEIESLLAVEIDQATGRAIIDASSLDTDDLYTELWVIPEDGTPRSLGTFPSDGESTITLPQPVLELIDAGVALAVSLEPEGGSPTGQPTGPIIGLGQLRAY